MPPLPLHLSPQLFAIFSGLIEEHAGLHYAPGDRDLLEHKLVARASDAGFESLLDYYYFLRYDPGGPVELEALIDALVVGETYFFRELPQLELLVDELVAPRVRAGKPVRIWSAACASGEEPLSIAMLLAERQMLDKVEIVATDVSRRALARARTASFGKRSLRSTVPTPGAKRFLEMVSDRIAVDRALVDRVQFRRLNLFDEGAVAEMPPADVILCRNVLIYFSDDNARRVSARLAARLTPGGALFVGVSESLLRFGTELACEERNGVFFYRRAA
jgi:chemotaxis protein methyltransferase CheR